MEKGLETARPHSRKNSALLQRGALRSGALRRLHGLNYHDYSNEMPLLIYKNITLPGPAAEPL